MILLQDKVLYLKVGDSSFLWNAGNKKTNAHVVIFRKNDIANFICFKNIKSTAINDSSLPSLLFFSSFALK